ncbi:UNVERIFIED_ORG: hypothetical protein FHR63_002598 [Xanthomonas campestris]
MRRACWAVGASHVAIADDVAADRWLTDFLHWPRTAQASTRALKALLADQRWQCWERGVASGGGTVWRHGCRHRASWDGFTACPDTGCDAAPPADSAHRSICARHLSVLRECFGLPRALARVPAWDTPQVRPCRLQCGIHAAQDPTPVRAQAPPIAIGCGKKCEQPDELHVLPSATIPDDIPAVGTQTTHANPECPIPNPGGSSDRISSRCTTSLIAAYSP